jgi:molecular chaperone GrpE
MKFNDMLKKKKKENMDTENINEPTPENLAEEQQLKDTQAETVETEQVAGPTAEEKLKDELAQANDKYLRLYAEFDNFRRRTQKERAQKPVRLKGKT